MTATLLVAQRSVRKYLRTPQLIVIGTVQGAMFLLIFRYVFGGAITGTGVSYVNFLVPGFVVTTVLFVGSGAAAGVAEDVEQGFVDRLRSLPISRLAGVAGRALADTATLVWALAITTAIGFAVGFRLDAHAGAALAAFGLSVVFGFAFAWVFICIGLFAGNAQAAQGMSLLVFPLTFVSSAYVPVASMPSWMRGVASQPADHGHDECGPLPHAGQRGHRAPRAHRRVVRGGVADLGGRARSGVRPDRGVALLAGQRVSGLYAMR